MRLKQNVDDVAILIHGTPKVLLLAVDSHEKFIDMPAIAETPLPLPKTPCKVSRKLLTATSNGFVGDCDAAFGKKIFNISEAQAEAMIDPHGVTDNLRWKTVSMVTRSRISHELSLSIRNQVDNTIERARQGRMGTGRRLHRQPVRSFLFQAAQRVTRTRREHALLLHRMTEAVRPLAAGFQYLDLETIEAGAQPENLSSFAVMRCAGMSPIGERVVWADNRKRNKRCLFYTIERSAFEASLLSKWDW
jgi:hypothetical protein